MAPRFNSANDTRPPKTAVVKFLRLICLLEDQRVDSPGGAVAVRRTISASRLQNGWEKCADRQTKALNLCASLRGEAQAALAGLDQ